MLNIVFIILLILAVIFLILLLETNSLALGVIDGSLWFILSAAVMNIDIPYQIYNVVTEEIETGVQVVESEYMLSWLFTLIGIVVFLYIFVSIIFPMLQQKFSKVM